MHDRTRIAVRCPLFGGAMTELLTPEHHVRNALRRLNPTFHERDISWTSLDKIVASSREAYTILNAFVNAVDFEEFSSPAMRQRIVAARDALREALDGS